MSNESQTKNTATVSRRILVIEDNLDSAEVLQTFLEIHGHEIIVKSTAAEGLESARQVAPDLIICDISLSGDLDGYDVATEIRRHDRFKSTFLVALSGYGRPEDKAKSKSAGFDKHLTKPTDFDALIQIINNFDRWEPFNAETQRRKDKILLTESRWAKTSFSKRIFLSTFSPL